MFPDSLAGHLLEKSDLAGGVFLPGPSPAYLLSKPLNWRDFDPSYPKKPKTLGDYIRKYRMEKGLMIRELAEKLGVTEDTVINWEVRGVKPCREHFLRLTRHVPEIAVVSNLDGVAKIKGNIDFT